MKIPSSAGSNKPAIVTAAVVVVALTLGCAVARQAGATTTAGPTTGSPVGYMGAGWEYGGNVYRPKTVAVVTDPASPSVVDGVYRLTWSEKEAIAAGAPYSSAHADFAWADGKLVILTMRLRDGHLSFTDRHLICRDTYTVSGKTISIENVAPCGGRIIAGWSLDNGQLRLRVTRATDPGDAVIFGSKPWKKIA
jgi:hypothetical protein